MEHNVIYALLMTLMAGLATGIGSLIAFFTRKTNTRFLSLSLGFSAGVMIYISFMEMLYGARVELGEITGSGKTGDIIAVAALFGGILLAALIDKMIPASENPHELHSVEELSGGNGTQAHIHTKRLHHTGFVTALAIAIHNFPEGIAAFMTAYENSGVGLAIAIAIAIHNIPEGVAVAVPIYYATGNKKRACIYSMLSGLAEPIGALIAFAILLPFITPILLNCTMAMVAGIMIYISFDELLPAAHQYGHSHLAIGGVVGGMLVMAASLILLK